MPGTAVPSGWTWRPLPRRTCEQPAGSAATGGRGTVPGVSLHSASAPLSPDLPLDQEAWALVVHGSPRWHTDPGCPRFPRGQPATVYEASLRLLGHLVCFDGRSRSPCLDCAAQTALLVALAAADQEPGRARVCPVRCPTGSHARCSGCWILSRVASGCGAAVADGASHGVITVLRLHSDWWDPVRTQWLVMDPVDPEVVAGLTSEVLETAWELRSPAQLSGKGYRRQGRWRSPVEFDLALAAAIHT